MSAMVSQITSVSIVYSTVCSGADEGKHQNSASLALVRGIHWWPVNSPHKEPVTREMFPFDDVINIVCKLSQGWRQWNAFIVTNASGIWAPRLPWHPLRLVPMAPICPPAPWKSAEDPPTSVRYGGGSQNSRGIFENFKARSRCLRQG